MTTKTPTVQTSWLYHPFFAPIAAIIAVLGIILKSVLMGDFGQIGIDNDDKMRLQQIKDYLAGQSWFDTDQYRLGLEAGTNMHWSRLVDLPIILLTKFFDLFMSADQALAWAISLWPPISAFILFSALLIAARNWAKDKDIEPAIMRLFTLALSVIFVFSYFRFSPGAIDHHNVQMGLMVLAVGLAIGQAKRFRLLFLSGLALAFSIAIGVEVYLFAAVICGFMAVNWAVQGAESRRGTQGFGLGLALGLAAAFFATIAPSEYGVIACDALSVTTLTAGLAGGLGLVIAAQFMSEKSRAIRWGALGVLGIVCLALLANQAPQCLSNPLDVLPDDVRQLWLGQIDEAQSITGPDVNKLAEIPLMIGPPIVALIVLILGTLKKKLWGQDILWIGLILTALALTCYQIRFYPFAYVFSIIPLAGWITQLFKNGKDKDSGSVAYLGGLALAIPFLWSAPGLLLGGQAKMQAEAVQSTEAANCMTNDLIETLNALPTGVVLADSNYAGPLLLATQHRYVSGNYHRNWRGIQIEVEAAISKPSKSYALMKQAGADYFIFCNGGGIVKPYIDVNSDGLYARLNRGKVPEFLTPVRDIAPASGQSAIYRIN